MRLNGRRGWRERGREQLAHARDSVWHTQRALIDELRQVSLRGPRARESLKTALSVLLAVALGKQLRLDDLWWVAFSGFMVLRPSIEETFYRGIYRIVGTALGAASGVALAPLLAGHLWWRSGWIFGFNAVVLYLALRARYAYAWLFLALTHVMVLAYATLEPHAVLPFASLRIIDVALGTAACLAVATVFEWQQRPSSPWFGPALRGLRDRREPGLRAPLQPGVPTHLLQHVLEASVAIAAVTALGHVVRVVPFTQASITIFTVMLVPLTDFATNRRQAVQRKLAQRCLGCVLGCLIGMLWLSLTAYLPWLWWPLLLLGVWLGQHLQTSTHGIGYIGTQFALGFLTAFVHDAHLHESYAAALQRTAGILTGLLVLGIVLVAGAMLMAKRESERMPS